MAADHTWLTRSDNHLAGYRGTEDDPRAVRWATRMLQRLADPDWSKWHFTEGRGLFTACGEPVQIFTIDGSPQEGALSKINCLRCQAAMNRSGVMASTS